MNEVLNVPKDSAFPKAGSGDHGANFDVLNQAKQEAWEHYLEGGLRNINRGYQGPERRSLTSRIDREIFVISGMKMHLKGEKERNKFINGYQDWAPTSLAEGRDGLIGLQKRISIAAKTNIENLEPEVLGRVREHAVERRVRSFQGYLVEAAHDLDTLQKIMVHPENEDSRPDPSQFRRSEEAQEVIAKQLLSRGLLWDKWEDRWPSSSSDAYKERQKYWRGFVIQATKSASDEALVHLLEIFYGRAEARFKFLNNEYSKAEQLPVVQSLIQKGELVPITSGRLLAKKYDREWKEERSLGEKIGNLTVKETISMPGEQEGERSLDSSPAPKTREINSFDELIPEAEVAKMASLALRYADKADQIERYVQDQGMSQQTAELRVLGGRAEWYQGHIIGVKKEDDQPSTEALVKHELDRKERLRRRFNKRR